MTACQLRERTDFEQYLLLDGLTTLSSNNSNAHHERKVSFWGLALYHPWLMSQNGVYDFGSFPDGRERQHWPG